MEFDGFTPDMVKDIRHQEEHVKKQLVGLRDALVGRIRNMVLDDVSPLPGAPFVATVKLGAVAASDGFILSPEYYIPASQAKLVEQKLKNVEGSGLSGFFSCLSEMREKKAVQIGKDRFALNPKTLSAIDEVLQLD